MTRTAINKVWSSAGLGDSQFCLKTKTTHYLTMRNSHWLLSHCSSQECFLVRDVSENARRKIKGFPSHLPKGVRKYYLRPWVVKTLLLLQKADWHCLILSAVTLLPIHSKTKLGLRLVPLKWNLTKKRGFPFLRERNTDPACSCYYIGSQVWYM